MTDTPEAEVIDGRAARRDRGKEAVLDAVIDLFTEGDLNPSPERVAERSGRSLSSVYRYFEDRDDLLRSAIERKIGEVAPLVALHAIGEGPLDERVDALVTSRLLLHQAIAPTARASRARAATSEIFRHRVDLTRHELGTQIELQFAPELAVLGPDQRRSAVGAIDALTQLETLDLHRVTRGLSVAETHDLLVYAIHALLGPSTRSAP